MNDDKELVSTIENSLNSLVGALGAGAPNPFSQQLSQSTTLFLNLRWYMVSNNRQLLSQMYVEHGIIQTLIDQPVDDAYSTGFEIHSGQLDGNDIEELVAFMEETQAIHAVMQASKWQRLYGGGAVMVLTGPNYTTPLTIDQLKEGSLLEFVAVDLWELYNTILNPVPSDMQFEAMPEYFDYYGIRVHSSRVMIMKGKEAPSFVRPRLRGWGMSEVERMVRSMNSYLKNQDVVFELLDEAKIDVYKMKGFNAALMNKEGTNRIASRVQDANTIKNFQHALTMDTDDEYQQKQMSFAGLPDILTNIRQGIAADVKMPMTKLFGISATGFNSGEDDIENYNSMINSEIRAKSKYKVLQIIKICCQIKFGFIPDDLKITWNPLRELSATDEESVKTTKFNRVMSGFSSGLISAKEARESINKDHLLPVEIDESDEVYDIPGAEDDQADVSSVKMKETGKKPK